ncbi:MULTISPECIES: hypothetical protein [Planktothricoides]|uniref:Uncharacterized protein n=1 Tax=Planktothricoides raciborskii GIHE-MW2 TaxID=2792601 RepID=A0AAU8JI55_9CYAN|nr:MULTISPECIES: hypothetical protein [Planktothricoides]
MDEEIAIGAIGAIEAIDLLTDSGVQAKIDGKTKRQPQICQLS